MSILKRKLAAAAVGSVVLALSSAPSWGCECGCGVFDINVGGIIPNMEGGTVTLEYDHMDQNRNWSGTSSSAPANNDDKEIRTDFYTADLDYMFNRKNGVSLMVPYWHRTFTTETDDPNPGDVDTFTHAALGDIRVQGIYMPRDMSNGFTYGLKLATGDNTYPNFDPDTSIGSGSTDLLLGAYHLGQFARTTRLNWFVRGLVDQPFMIQNSYRPGGEIDALYGVYAPGKEHRGVKVIPVLQLIGSYRLRDTGANADTPDSGYTRVLVAPAVEVHVKDLKFFGQVGTPIYNDVRGNQLISKFLLKLSVSKDF